MKFIISTKIERKYLKMIYNKTEIIKNNII